MMYENDFDLHQALESSDGTDMDFEVDSQKIQRGLRREVSICSLDDGIMLRVYSEPHSMRHVAQLIIALQRLKNSHKVQKTEFDDQELLSIMMESVIEECVVVTVEENLDSNSTFTCKSKTECNVCDQYQKSLVLNEEALLLQAMWLQGGSFHHKVRLNLSTYVTPSFLGGQAQPVALGIAGTSFYLSCSTNQGLPVLQLEEVNSSSKLQIIKAQADMARFLFLKRSSGVSMTSFESVLHRGWYISTKGDREPVDMCKKEDATRYTSFIVKTV